MMIEMARRIVSSADAEDVVGSVVVDLWQRRKLARFEGRSSLKTWLGAVVINAALNARRRVDRPDARAELPEYSSEPRAETEPAAEDQKLVAVLGDAIASLPPPTRALVLMYYEQDLTLDALTKVHGTSKSTLSRMLRDARDQIRAEADRLARTRWGVSLMSLREGVDFARLELDLRMACRGTGNARRRSVSKS